MTSILEFLSKHYLIFKLDSNNNTQNISEVNTMQNQINTNMSLQDLVKENKNIGNNESSNL